MRRILILGGTSEARELAARLAQRNDLAVTLSLAGRTAAPAAQAVPVRSGGFGGKAGLAAYLTEHHIDALIDATHPFAANISANAAQAVTTTGVPLLTLQRPPWQMIAGDRWIDVNDVDEAVGALGATPRRVFLAIGRQDVNAFVAAPQHAYVVRSIDPVEPPLALPHAEYSLARGPFDTSAECELITTRGIGIVVAKNSGGEATYGKIAAARALRLPVVMIRRPPAPTGPTVATIDAAAAWLDHALASATRRGV
ncbi:MAG: cobalt-precorrin-6A reductase [Pseudolabrys sp.]